METNSISRYLDRTRIGHVSEPTSDVKILFDKIVYICRKELEHSRNIRTNIVAVHTLNMSSEIVKIGDEFLLVYDQTVVAAASLLTRILLWSEHNQISERALAQVFEIEGMRVGDITGVAFGMGHAVRSHAALDMLPMIDSSYDAKLDLYLQQLFLFLHEYCHILMRIDPQFASWRIQVGEFLIEAAQDTSNMDRQYVAYRHDKRHTDSFEQFKRNRLWQIQFYRRYRKTLSQEIACDEFALSVLYNICRGEGIDPSFAFRAAVLSIRHMRTINYVRHAVRRREADRSIDHQTPILLISARKYVLVKSFREISQIRGMTAEWASNMVRELNTLSDAYIDKIEELLKRSVIPAYENAYEHRAIKDELLSIRNAQHLSQAVGWNPPRAGVNFLVFD
jgi:hypothetical protein